MGLGCYLLGAPPSPSAVLPLLSLIVSGVTLLGGLWAAWSLQKLRRASGLEQAREAWLRTSAVPAVLPAGGAGTAPPAKETRGGRRSRGAELLVVGAVGLLFLCVCSVVGTTTYLLWRAVTRLVNSTDLAAPGRPADPNAPDPDEGPPPPGWTVLFRSDDPSVWNTDSPGKNFVLPVRRAHSKIRFLRLTRLDTHEALIVPVEHFELARDDRPPSAPGHWWAGKSQKVWGAYRLGIAGVPSASRDNVGIIGLAFDHTTVYSGSGFGFKTGLGDQQYYC